MLTLLARIFCQLPGWMEFVWNKLGQPEIERNPANAITIARGLLVLYVGHVLFDLYLLTDSRPILAALFALLIVCGALDWADGFVAKRFGYESEAGRRLDPIADSFLIFWGSVWLASVYRFDMMMVVPMTTITLLGLLIYFGKRSVDGRVRTPVVAKAAIGTLYFSAVTLMFAACINGTLTASLGWDLIWGFLVTLGYCGFWVATVLMMISAIWYFRGVLARLLVRSRSYETT